MYDSVTDRLHSETPNYKALSGRLNKTYKVNWFAERPQEHSMSDKGNPAATKVAPNPWRKAGGAAPLNPSIKVIPKRGNNEL